MRSTGRLATLHRGWAETLRPLDQGRHKRETLYGLSGKKAARAVLSERLQKAGSISLEAVDLTPGSFVEAYWKPYLERKQTKPSTRRGYQAVLDNHILPMLGEMRLAEVTPLNVEELLQVKTRAGFSPRTLRNITVQLNAIFHLAEDNDLINRSPVRDRHKPVCHKTEKPVWTPDQVRMILAEVAASFRCLFVCVALTCLRLGELLALQWRHIDLGSRVLWVAQSLWNGQLVSPKSVASARRIPFGEILARELEAHRKGSAFTGPEDFVFCKADGTPFNPDVLRKDVICPVLDRLHIPRVKRGSGFHCFRHSNHRPWGYEFLHSPESVTKRTKCANKYADS